ncbi:MAG: hypothetical protein MPJ50_17320 [Pirellulales bacterium]|nr:hypothetical protein [Pirellulales bacterium]
MKRALNYAAERKLIPANPIKGYRVPRVNSRVTYITPDQESLCYEHSGSPFALALRVCIRTGARFGCEFAALTKPMLLIMASGWNGYSSGTKKKTRKKRRIIRITDPEIMEIVRTQLSRFPRGPLFRNHHGTAWTSKTLSHAFRRMKARMLRGGHQLDADCCMYSCRHTYAKRILQGYWSGNPPTSRHWLA